MTTDARYMCQLMKENISSRQGLLAIQSVVIALTRLYNTDKSYRRALSVTHVLSIDKLVIMRGQILTWTAHYRAGMDSVRTLTAASVQCDSRTPEK